MSKDHKALTEKVRTFLQKVATTDKNEAYRLLSEKQREAVTRYLLIVWQNQTADEQADQTTRHRNGKGFSGLTGSNPFVISLCQQAEAGRILSAKQAVVAAKKIVRYAGQIAAAAPAPTPSPLSDDPSRGNQAEEDLADWEAQNDLRQERIDKKAHKRAIRETIPAGHVRPHKIGPDGLTDSERAFIQLSATFGQPFQQSLL